MGYQALLFCSDEKTTRAVAQVLSELDFEFVACTEPFGAVKKLMANHFDAVVVDCDNEQNATLLFKSARNAPNNLTALAVAIVEGQAGVAKAFRIGANLVLTKPINIELAKGTLRAARGLVRKSEAAKPTSAAGAAAKSSTAVSPPSAGKSAAAAQGAKAPVSRPERPTGPVWPAEAKTLPPDPLPVDAPEDSQSLARPAMRSASDMANSAPAPSLKSQPEPAERMRPSLSGSSGAASAPAPAREVKPAGSSGEKPSANTLAGGVPIIATGSSAEDSDPALESDGVEAATKSESGGIGKILMAVCAILSIAAASYLGWTQQEILKKFIRNPQSVLGKPRATLESSPNPPAIPAANLASASTAPPHISSSAASMPSTPATDPAVHVAEVTQLPQTESIGPASSPRPAPGKRLIKLQRSKSGLTSDANAPSITMIAANSDGPLPSLIASAESIPAPVLASRPAGFSPGSPIKQIQPLYPSRALHMGIQGSVQLLASVSKQGDVSSVKILGGNNDLTRAAADAVKQWKYKPYLLNGNPVEIQIPVTVSFKLPQ